MADKDKLSPVSYEDVLLREGRLVFTPGGNSMRPLLKDHENPVVILPVTENTVLKKYDVVFYKRQNGQYVLHRIIRCRSDGTYTMCGDGQYYTEKNVTRDMIFGILEGYYKGELYINVSSSLKYKLYSFFRIFTLPVRSLFFRGVKRIKSKLIRK